MKAGKLALIGGALIAVAACSQESGNDAAAAGEDLANGAFGQPITPTVAPRAEPASAPIHVGDKTLSNPSDFQAAVAYYQIVGLEPPFDAWARSDPRVRQANEFDRPTASARVQEELLLASRAVAGVGNFEINTSSRFGEYDMASQGFRLEAIDSDRFWTWNHEDGRYKLTMENGNEAQLWKIPTDEARALIEGMSYRNVDLKLRIKVVGAIPEGNGGTLQGRIAGYEVLNREGRKVGEMSF